MPVVAAYTHLGSLLHHRGDMRHEARRRYSIAQSAFQQHRKVLYQNRQLSLQRRCELFRIMILSKYVYGCDSWTLRDRRTKHHIHTLLHLYRRLLPRAVVELLCDDEVLSRTGLVDPTDLFRQQRLRHLGALYACADDVPRGLLNSVLNGQRSLQMIFSGCGAIWSALPLCLTLQIILQHGFI